MKKRILSILLIGILVIGLTGCGSKKESDNGSNSAIKNGKEITYAANLNGNKLNIKVTIPEGSNYEFTETKPVTNGNVTGSVYLNGDKLLMAFDNDSYSRYGADVASFKEFADYLASDEYKGKFKPIENLTIGGKDAVKFEYKWGNGSGELHGYRYFIDASDVIGEKKFIQVGVFTPDLGTENVESTFSDSEVNAMIQSIKFTK